MQFRIDAMQMVVVVVLVVVVVVILPLADAISGLTIRIDDADAMGRTMNSTTKTTRGGRKGDVR